jgi:hypothetical protein
VAAFIWIEVLNKKVSPEHQENACGMFLDKCAAFVQSCVQIQQNLQRDLEHLPAPCATMGSEYPVMYPMHQLWKQETAQVLSAQ